MTPAVTSANYDSMARYYDAITRIISIGGNTRAQRHLLKHVRPSDRVLHAGCGSVRFNEDLARACARVVGVDVSHRMVERARRRLVRAGLDGRTELVCEDVMRYERGEPFDVVFANFFLNTFSWEDCRRVLDHLARQVRPGGLLCIADEALPLGSRVVTGPQRVLRWLVTWSHHVWVDHPMHAVYDYDPGLAALGFEVVDRHRDRCGYITATAYSHVS
jgi:ubiquinone/menaquinone biosynthesis C-methylase UbiE